MPRSRIVRALAAGIAGIVGAGSVVCMALAYTHAAHHATRVASLAAVPAVGGAPRAVEPSAGLLAWHALTAPSPLRLSPVVVGSVRVVQTTRYVKAGGAVTPGARVSAAAPRTTPARHVAMPRREAPAPRRTTARASTRTDRHTTRDRTGDRSDEQRRDSDGESRRTADGSHDGDAERDDDE